MNDKTLHSFYNSVQSDPLFAAEGMDLEQASAALDRIEILVKEAEMLVSSTSIWRRLFLIRYPTARYAIPIRFLRAFIESERQRRKFVVYPTMESAQLLLAQWEKTAHVYTTCARKYRWLHEAVVQVKKLPDTFAFQDFCGNVTSLASIFEIIRLVERNAHALAEDVHRRKLLLTKGVPFSTTRTVDVLPPYTPTTISPELQHLVDLDRLHGYPFRDNTIVQTFGPFLYTLSHYDVAPTPHAFYAHIVEDASSKARMFKVSLADEFFLLDLRGELDVRNRGLQGPIIERGITHWVQSMTHLYATRDQRYNADIATQIDLELRPWLNRENVIMQRSSSLDLILMSCAFDLVMYLDNARVRIKDGSLGRYPLIDTLLIRTLPSIYFLPFNASVWRLSETPNFLGTKDGSVMKYQRYSDIKDVLPEGMIDRIMEGTRIRAEARQKA
jgi:hypothetical protein